MQAWVCHICFQLAVLRGSSGNLLPTCATTRLRNAARVFLACVRGCFKVERRMPSRRWSLNTKVAHWRATACFVKRQTSTLR